MFDVRTSERRCFKRCPQRWYWAYVCGFKSLRVANPLWFGQAWHVAMSEWYQPGLRRGPHPAETFSNVLKGDRLVRVTNEDEEGEFIDARNLGIEMANNYIHEYGDDPTWDIIVTEKEFKFVLSSLDGGIKRWMRYRGTLDGIRRDPETGKLYIIEHKTAASISTAHLPLDDQGGSYWLFGPKILKSLGLTDGSRPLEYIEYNFARKAKKDTRPTNHQGLRCNKPLKKHYIDAINAVSPGAVTSKMSIKVLEATANHIGVTVIGDVSKSQPPSLFLREPVYRDPKERRSQLQRIKEESLYMERMRAGDPNYPIWKNPTWECSWDCPFFRMCQLDEQGDDLAVEEFAEVMYRVGDPYSNDDGPEGIKSA